MNRIRLRSEASVAMVLLGISIAANAGLAYRVHALRGYVEALREGVTLRIGSRVSPISARDVNGVPNTLTYTGPLPTVLYVFKPECGWCQRNRGNFAALCSQVGGRYRVVALSLSNTEDLREFVAKSHMTAPVLWDLQPVTVTEYRLGGTPTTIVISTERIVLKRWVGAYSDTVGKEVESYLDVRFPGLTNQAPPA
jgi:peroxiredoxin